MQDIERNIFDEDEIIRDYKPHHKRPSTDAPPSRQTPDAHDLHTLDTTEYSYYHPNSNHNPCNQFQFRCANNVCIPLHLRCDGFFHCNDLSDESGCDKYQAQPQTPPANVVHTTTKATPTRTRPTKAITTTTTRRPITTTTRYVPTTTPAPSMLQLKRKGFKFKKKKELESLFKFQNSFWLPPSLSISLLFALFPLLKVDYFIVILKIFSEFVRDRETNQHKFKDLLKHIH